MTINIPGDRSIGSTPASSTPETTSSVRTGSIRSTNGTAGLEDHISVSSSTSNIHATLDDLSAARAARVSQLTQLYASGRYAGDSTGAAASLVASATTTDPE